ncbi:hypothetical protein [Streptomyces sp. NPDC014793]|uniref:hypothetical protein n=1 Tax=Streptomyces sp. NPDC014793 TaxID=3364914 RepID=UPI0036F51F8F
MMAPFAPVREVFAGRGMWDGIAAAGCPADLIPAGVRIVAMGSGLDIDQTIINE